MCSHLPVCLPTRVHVRAEHMCMRTQVCTIACLHVGGLLCMCARAHASAGLIAHTLDSFDCLLACVRAPSHTFTHALVVFLLAMPDSCRFRCTCLCTTLEKSSHNPQSSQLSGNTILLRAAVCIDFSYPVTCSRLCQKSGISLPQGPSVPAFLRYGWLAGWLAAVAWQRSLAR